MFLSNVKVVNLSYTGDRDQAAALLAAVPRTCRALGWLARSVVDYSVVKRSFPGQEGEIYAAALDEVHQSRAKALLDLCQKNGSLYIKVTCFNLQRRYHYQGDDAAIEDIQINWLICVLCVYSIDKS